MKKYYKNIKLTNHVCMSINKSRISSIGVYILTLLLGCIFFVQQSIAHETMPTANIENMQQYFDSLDASGTMPEGLSREYIRNVVKNAGGNNNDIKFIIKTFNSDICGFEDMKSACAYMGRDTLNKASNLAWQASSAGASNEEIMAMIAPVMEYGISRNLENLYGEKGLSDENFIKLNDELGLTTDHSGLHERNKLPVGQSGLLDRKGLTQRLLCLGLRTAIDEQTINSTNPLYGKKYRMVTCAAGFNWRFSIRLFFLKISAQVGTVVTHSRFARKILFWHLTGADPHICATANAMGNIKTKCNNYNWSSPVVFKANFLWNKPAGVVMAHGHAVKLGREFNTAIGF